MTETQQPKGWIGVDFDGTLAHYTTWQGPMHCGAPVAAMVQRVRQWLAQGWEVRVFTARAYPLNECVPPDMELRALTEFEKELIAENEEDPVRWQQALDAVVAIRAWCLQQFGKVLAVTNVKDHAMVELWDDRCVQVAANTGQPVRDALQAKIRALVDGETKELSDDQDRLVRDLLDEGFRFRRRK